MIVASWRISLLDCSAAVLKCFFWLRKNGKEDGMLAAGFCNLWHSAQAFFIGGNAYGTRLCCPVFQF